MSTAFDFSAPEGHFEFVPVLCEDGVAILGVGAIEKRPVVATDAEGNDTILFNGNDHLKLPGALLSVTKVKW